MKPAQNKTALFFTLRYLFAKKQHNIINVISLVSIIGIIISTAALIVVLSVFNGMEKMIGSWFNTFNPDFEITLAEGKSFDVDSFPSAKIASLPEVAGVYEIVSDLVLTTYNDRQELLRLKGVPGNYFASHNYQDILLDGTFDFYQGEQPCAIVGSIAAGKLLINLRSFNLLNVYYPKRTKKNFADPTQAFNTRHLFPAGVFSTNTDHDQTYVFCPIEFTRDLMQYEGQATSMEIQLKDSRLYKKTQKKIEQMVGPAYQVKNKYQQEETLFKTMQSEKLIIFVILVFILTVAAFNIIGSLGMLILEKRSDTAILHSMGAPAELIQRIFLYEGMLISGIGGVVGMIVGSLICFIQQTFHVVKLGNGDGNYLISYYPVNMRFTDFVWIGLTILAISIITAAIPARALKKASLK